ncbi:hypothetical protein Ciccas_009379 [Cichlidogyrus casuarinus]|uniref:Uncharacterized protein n=1 Tax=Cichlidogyrus casuarinus TaxID=1844966 RepID=A0ABD2PYM1_9PLAT
MSPVKPKQQQLPQPVLRPPPPPPPPPPRIENFLQQETETDSSSGEPDYLRRACKRIEQMPAVVVNEESSSESESPSEESYSSTSSYQSQQMTEVRRKAAFLEQNMYREAAEAGEMSRNDGAERNRRGSSQKQPPLAEPQRNLQVSPGPSNQEQIVQGLLSLGGNRGPKRDPPPMDAYYQLCQFAKNSPVYQQQPQIETTPAVTNALRMLTPTNSAKPRTLIVRAPDSNGHEVGPGLRG